MHYQESLIKVILTSAVGIMWVKDFLFVMGLNKIEIVLRFVYMLGV